MKALILDTIHNIDITRLLIGAGPDLRDHTHWLWQKQLRNYLKDGQSKIDRDMLMQNHPCLRLFFPPA